MRGSLCLALCLALATLLEARVPSQRAAAASIRPPTEDAGPSSRIRYTPAAEEARVTELPGWGKLTNYSMFAGYEAVGDRKHRYLYYTFVESSKDAANDPVILWLNGGPGCSSVGGGFLSELGAFLPNPDGKTLQANPYGWNRVASTLFVDSPVFVGWSYSGNPNDAVVGDERTAVDLREFLLAFLERFPHLKDNDLYIAGESYGGHYVPNLAWEIVKGNQAAGSKNQEGYINLAGIMVGNPWTDAAIDNKGALDYWWSHAMLSDQVYEGIDENCDFSSVGPLAARHKQAALSSTVDPDKCDEFVDRAFFSIAGIDIYHIYADVCTPVRQAAPARALTHALQRHNVPLRSSSSSSSSSKDGASGGKSSTSSGSSSDSSARVGAKRTLLGLKDMDDDDGDHGGPVPKQDPCIDNEVAAYLNQPEVQRAMHANTTGKIPGPWQDCSPAVLYSREDLLTSMLPVWKKLLSTGGLRFLVYSGDVDGIVPVIGTRRWVASLGLPEAKAWKSWTSGPTAQVGGFSVHYTTEGSSLRGDSAPSQLVFSTVRGAGHMVPYTQPQRALHLITHFLNDKPL